MHDQVEGLKRQQELREAAAEPAGDMFDYSSYFPIVLPMRQPFLEPSPEENSEEAHIPRELSLVSIKLNLSIA